ncbi:MAG: DegT/DnrJ/EryC1/StrS family aminotransferase, partial [Candidatus Melainabacteria bacterium HGW-Melainabacteria-1]
MSIPMLDLTRIHAPLEAELKAAFERVLHANSYILGKEVSEFETACAAYLGVKHAIGVSSGTDALLLALMTLGVGPGDEVICPSYTFFATAGAIARLGATPVFVDSDPDTYNWDLNQVFAAANERTRAVIPVHLFGQCADLDGLSGWAGERGLVIIEDVAQSMGATWRQSMSGSIGDFGCHSFFPSKNLGGFGDGGLLTTDNDSLAEKARVLRAHGAKPKYYHHFVGGNFRIDALQAALLSVKLPHLESWIGERRTVAQRYR